MPLQADVFLDDREFQRQLGQWLRYTDRALPDEMRHQGRLWGEMVMRFTPPKNYAQGRRAVARDINRVFARRERGFLEWIVEHFGADVEELTLNAGGGKPLHIHWAGVDVGGLLMSVHHESKRGPKGRVRRSVGRAPSTWFDPDRLAVPDAVFRRYVRARQQRVGLAKSGWAIGVLMLGGRVPRWVQRHLAGRWGAFVDETGNRTSPALTYFNYSPWGRNTAEAGRIMTAATRVRARALAGAVRWTLEQRARELGIEVRRL